MKNKKTTKNKAKTKDKTKQNKNLTGRLNDRVKPDNS